MTEEKTLIKQSTYKEVMFTFYGKSIYVVSKNGKEWYIDYYKSTCHYVTKDLLPKLNRQLKRYGLTWKDNPLLYGKTKYKRPKGYALWDADERYVAFYDNNNNLLDYSKLTNGVCVGGPCLLYDCILGGTYPGDKNFKRVIDYVLSKGCVIDNYYKHDFWNRTTKNYYCYELTITSNFDDTARYSFHITGNKDNGYVELKDFWEYPPCLRDEIHAACRELEEVEGIEVRLTSNDKVNEIELL